jgi:hypothetical protein
MLTAGGYTGTSADATLANLRGVSGDGVFYIRTHGGMASIHRDGSTQDLYALWTSSEVLDPLVEEQDATLVADLLTQRVVYMLFRNDRWNQAFPSLFERNRHYGITSKFVAHHMSFAPDSLIYVDACNSASDAGFRAAFPGGSLFVGWDERAEIAGAARTAQFVFDRLLGANQFAPESPKQRPFDHQALASDPKFGPGKTYGSSRAIASDGMTPIVANLGFHRLRGDFGLLAPSLYALEADEDAGKLILHGNFGRDPGGDGQVIISDGGETALPVTSWGAHRIEATLPASGNGSRGNVKVVVRDRASNTRQLIGWKGTMTWTMDDAGSLVMRVQMDMLLRMDPLDVRDAPGAAPKKNPLTIGGRNPDMSASYELGGTFTTSHDGCTFTYDWAGSGEIPFGLPNADRFYDYCGKIDAERSVMQTFGMALDLQGADVKVTVTCDGMTNSNNGPAPVVGALSPFAGAEAFWLDLPVDGSLSLGGASRMTSVRSAVPEDVPEATLHLDWSTIAAVPSYDSTLPR